MAELFQEDGSSTLARVSSYLLTQINRLKRRGDFYFAKKQWNAALCLWTQCAEMLTSSSLARGSPGRRSCDVEAKELLLACQLNVSLASLKLGKYENAASAALAALILKPSSVKAKFRRASALAQLLSPDVSVKTMTVAERRKQQRWRREAIVLAISANAMKGGGDCAIRLLKQRLETMRCRECWECESTCSLGKCVAGFPRSRGERKKSDEQEGDEGEKEGKDEDLCSEYDEKANEDMSRNKMEKEKVIEEDGREKKKKKKNKERSEGTKSLRAATLQVLDQFLGPSRFTYVDVPEVLKRPEPIHSHEKEGRDLGIEGSEGNMSRNVNRVDRHRRRDEPENLVIFLHGAGDHRRPFTAFARHTQLPRTASVTIDAPMLLPTSLRETAAALAREAATNNPESETRGSGATNGRVANAAGSSSDEAMTSINEHHRVWFPTFHSRTGELLPSDSLKVQRGVEAAAAELRMLLRMLQYGKEKEFISENDNQGKRVENEEVRVGGAKWSGDRIHVIGYGQGAMVVLEALTSSFVDGTSFKAPLLRSVIAISGRLSPRTLAKFDGTLSCQGNNGDSTSADGCSSSSRCDPSRKIPTEGSIAVLLSDDDLNDGKSMEATVETLRRVSRGVVVAEVQVENHEKGEKAFERTPKGGTSRGTFLGSKEQAGAVFRFLSRVLVVPSAMPAGAVEVTQSFSQ